MRKWNMELFLVHAETGQHVPANAFERAIFHLHPSFEKRQKQIKTTPPFRIEEQGWGEFDMTIVLVPVGKGPQEEIKHDLNFAQERYEAKHEVVSKIAGGGWEIRHFWERRGVRMLQQRS